MELFTIMAVLAVATAYFLPTIIAIGRGKNNVGSIFALNLFLGWTLLFWVLALVWALAKD